MLYVLISYYPHILKSCYIKLEVGTLYYVWDSEDGSLEQHNGYEIKQLEQDSPGTFHNVILNKNFHGEAREMELPFGMYPIAGTDAYFFKSNYHGVLLWENGYLNSACVENGRLLSGNAPILKDEHGYYVRLYYYSASVHLKHLCKVDLTVLRRALVLDEFDKCVEDIISKFGIHINV